ncbi:MAG: sugar transferase [Paracoccaceae bacterium]
MKHSDLTLSAVARVLPAKNKTARLYSRIGKRALDLVLVVLALPVALPVIAGLWLLVRRDGGFGFYAQERIGRDGRVFACWKLRTMQMDAEKQLEKLCRIDPELAAEWARDQKLERDPRITKIGAFLRASSLDELPQIFNVLRGDMSLVGPRPFMISQEPLYRDAGGSAYFDMRPGITGPWQIDGRSGTTFVERIAYDNAYAQSLSLRADIALLLRTVSVVLNRTGR